MRFKAVLIATGIGAVLGAVALFAVLRAVAPQGKPRVDLSGASVVMRVRELGRLETTSFTIEKVIEAGASGGALHDFLFGDKLLLIAHGDVIGGVDLSKVGPNDVKVEGTRLTVRLPAPEVLSTRLDNAETRVYDRTQGIFARSDKDLESDARRAAEEAIRDAACKAGVLDAAAQNARKQLMALFTALGFVDVTLDVPPGSC
jgi:hypothetical protein